MSPSYTIPALARSFEVIECIARKPNGVAFSEIVNTLEAPKSSIFRILHTLEAEAWVEKKDDRYYLGYMLIHYGLTTLSRRSITDISRPILEALTEDTGETSHLAVPSGKKSMILEVSEAKKHIMTNSTTGNLLPLYCTSHGKIFLAHIIGDDLEGFYYGEVLEKRTKKTITELPDLHREMEKILDKGYSLDDEEYHDNVWCCAAPVFGRSGDCIGALGITGTTFTCTPERKPDIIEHVRDAAGKLSRQMGRIEK